MPISYFAEFFHLAKFPVSTAHRFVHHYAVQRQSTLKIRILDIKHRRFPLANQRECQVATILSDIATAMVTAAMSRLTLLQMQFNGRSNGS